MKILAIESASVTASCAISDDHVILGEYSLNHKKTHSEKLMPLVEKLLADMEININDIDVIAVSEGPGSYTGLRIGASIGKSLAYALNKPIANVPTMKSMASNIYNVGSLIVPVMDAKSGRAYSGIYRWEHEKLTSVKKQFPCNINELIDILNQYDEPVLLNGDGSENYRNEFEKLLKIKPIFSPKHFNYLKASSLCFLGYEMARNGNVIKASEFSPTYLRLSQAERNNK